MATTPMQNYLTWQMDEMVELIKGKVFKQAAALGLTTKELQV